MTQAGIGAMLHHLSGGSENSPHKYYGKKIKSIEMTEEKLTISFEDDVIISLWDNGQSCCEHRYMTTDDDVQSLVGKRLAWVEAKEGPSGHVGEGEYYGEEHETCFVEVQTENGFITLTNHNEHNGYYGGFGLTITEEQGVAQSG